MKRKILAAVLLVGLLGAAGYWWTHSGRPKQKAPVPSQTAQDAAVVQALATNPQVAALVASNFAAATHAASPAPVPSPALPVSRPAPLEFTNFAPATVLENMRRAIHDFGSQFGGNPVGTNLEITRQLSGNNPKHINFIRAEAGLRVNGNGELVDPWGTPYFFHQLSGMDMEIHSAGPDRVLWTTDDLVVSE